MYFISHHKSLSVCTKRALGFNISNTNINRRHSSVHSWLFFLYALILSFIVTTIVCIHSRRLILHISDLVFQLLFALLQILHFLHHWQFVLLWLQLKVHMLHYLFINCWRLPSSKCSSSVVDFSHHCN